MSASTSRGDQAARRSRQVVRHAGLGLIAKAAGVLASFVAMPLILDRLGPQQMGAWLVLLAVFQWVTFCDLGVASGARNQIARALAAGDIDEARKALSTGWIYTGVIAAALFVLAGAALLFTPALQVLGRTVFRGVDTAAATWIVLASACLSFAMAYVQTTYAALEKASAFAWFSFLSSSGFLLLLLLWPRHGLSSLTSIATAYAAALFVAHAVLILTFTRQHPELRLTRPAFDKCARRRIFSFGLRLFVIQFAALVIFTTDRLVVSWLIGPQTVVVYDAGYKVFGIVTLAHTLLMSTLWSSFTHAHAAGDRAWIVASLRRLVWLMLPLGAACLLLVAGAPWIIRHWLGEQQVGGEWLYAGFAAMTVLSCWSNVFAYFLNGVGDTAVQLYSAVTAAVVNLPLCVFFVKHLDMGLIGVLSATCVSLLFFSVLGPVQTALLLRRGTKQDEASR